jgi:urease accessory protein
LLWQLADSAFPTGSFAHSAGLEAAWQHSEVRNRAELLSFLEASLHQLGRGALPFVTAAYGEPERLDEFDEWCDAFTTNHVANRASRLQGRAFFAALERIFVASGGPHAPSRVAVGASPAAGASGQNIGQASSLSPNAGTSFRSQNWAGWKPALRFAHFAPVFGAVASKLGIGHETATRLFFFNHLRSSLAAAVRLNIVGPMDAQTIQLQLAPRAEEIRAQSDALTLDDVAQTSPPLDLWQGTQDRLYSRLFQS